MRVYAAKWFPFVAGRHAHILRGSFTERSFLRFTWYMGGTIRGRCFVAGGFYSSNAEATSLVLCYGSEPKSRNLI